MTAADFLFKDNFADMYDTDGDSLQVTEAIAEVQALFSGVSTLWASIDSATRDRKRTLCMNYLVGWYLADRFPLQTTGVTGTGGMPLTAKSIGGVALALKDMMSQEGMKQLESNSFGMKALMMVQGSPERFRLYG